MTFDPFADDVQPEATEAVTETNNSNDVWNDNVEVQTVTNPEGVTRISLTFKAGTGFDSPWIVIEGGTVPGVLGELKAQSAEFGELANLVSNGARALQKSYGGNAPAAPAQQQAQGGGGRPPQQSAPNGETKTCDHGEMVFRSGVSKSSGKPYKGFFCPSQDRNAQCSPQFIR